MRTSSRVWLPWNITPQRFSALVLMSRNPDLKLTELARVLNVARSGAVTIVDSLVELGYVARHDVPADKRAIRLRVTTAGTRGSLGDLGESAGARPTNRAHAVGGRAGAVHGIFATNGGDLT